MYLSEVSEISTPALGKRKKFGGGNIELIRSKSDDIMSLLYDRPAASPLRYFTILGAKQTRSSIVSFYFASRREDLVRYKESEFILIASG